MALWVWWSSATFGEGTNIAAFPAAQISEMEEAPERLISTSAIAYARSMREMKSLYLMLGSLRPCMNPSMPCL